MAAGVAGEADLCPVADGGEGTLELLVESRGGELRELAATGPLGGPVRASLGLLDGGRTALVAVSEASGLRHVPDPDPETAWAATTRGTGELAAAAASLGAETIVVACGGSATSDGGAGILEAWDPRGAQVVVLCDTEASFADAPELYAPQKGADETTVARLCRRLDELAGSLPRDPRGIPLTGAAGGVSGLLWAHGAELVGGAQWVLDALDFDARLRRARAVLTGEGRLDHTTRTGKALAHVATRARAAGVPCHAIVGRNELPEAEPALWLASVQEAGTPAAITAAARRVMG